MVTSRFEERLMPIAQAELCALLKAHAEKMDADEKAIILAEQLEELRLYTEALDLEEAIQTELQVANQETFGAWT